MQGSRAVAILAAAALALPCSGCTASPRPQAADAPVTSPAPSAAPSAVPVARPAAGSAAPTADFTRAPEWQKYLDAEGVEGALVLWEPAAGLPRCHGGARCTERFLPASTFKIPNSLIALETGVVPDANFTLEWDGTKYWVEAWNKDQDLRSAIRVSAVWYYQELARRIGAERMQGFVDRFDYGNRNIGGGIDRFWLFGDLRIAPLEQVGFLRKLQERKLPVSDRTVDIVRDITTLAQGDGWVLRGKTGSASAEDYPEPGHLHTGWLVGWVERGDRVVLYAVLALGPPDQPMDWSVRRRLAAALLEGEGVLPADAEPWP